MLFSARTRAPRSATRLESPWSAPIVLTAKAERRNARLRELSRSESHHQEETLILYPTLTSSFSQFHGARFFSTSDLRSGILTNRYGMEPVLPTPLSYPHPRRPWSVRSQGRDIAKEDQCAHVQNLDKYRTEAAQRYCDASEKLAKKSRYTQRS